MKDRCNKKSFGRSVRDSDIIGLALRQLRQNHIEELQEATLTERDRLKIAHEEYCKNHPKITIDQFLGKLLSANALGQNSKKISVEQ